LIDLRHFEALEHAQIAAQLGLSESQVRNLFFRALGRLMKCVGVESSNQKRVASRENGGGQSVQDGAEPSCPGGADE
jgi:hypothetical protein